MEEGVYQRVYFFGNETRCRNAYFAIGEIEQGVSVAVDLVMENGKLKPVYSGDGLKAHFMRIHLRNLNDGHLHSARAINSSENTQRVDLPLERRFEDLQGLAVKKFEKRKERNRNPFDLIWA